MESIKELRVKLQTNVLGHPILQRVPSIYVTRLFLLTSITANQISAVMIIVGIISGVVIAFGYIWLGLALIYLNLVLDAVDGELARYKKTFSMRGVYLDLVNHLVVFEAFFLGLTLAVSEVWTRPNFVLLTVGIVGALAMCMRRAIGDLHRVLFVRSYSEHPDLFRIPPTSSEANTGTASGAKPSSFRVLMKNILWYLHESHEGGYMIVVLVIAYAAERLLLPGALHYPILSWVVLYYGVTLCLYLTREIIGGFYSIESRIASLRDRFASK
ncbi:CDP-alcohol phosphatidyltransferase family protein [Candidatus Kaiserbacteria bacterium]|nr:CDP-alcohol phosphatidyltransferase family protein [Candidatus Kaiserbacteria bacterium]